eukprot:SAG11_NODE_50_length_19992_cov_9.945157_8_plen_178_part_00
MQQKFGVGKRIRRKIRLFISLNSWHPFSIGRTHFLGSLFFMRKTALMISLSSSVASSAESAGAGAGAGAGNPWALALYCATAALVRVLRKQTNGVMLVWLPFLRMCPHPVACSMDVQLANDKCRFCIGLHHRRCCGCAVHGLLLDLSLFWHLHGKVHPRSPRTDRLCRAQAATCSKS